jgi:hypothetical protein
MNKPTQLVLLSLYLILMSCSIQQPKQNATPETYSQQLRGYAAHNTRQDNEQARAKQAPEEIIRTCSQPFA